MSFKEVEEHLDRAEQALLRAEASRQLRTNSEPTGELDTDIALGWANIASVKLQYIMVEQAYQEGCSHHG